jgi:colicin import membrane protein
MASRIEASVMTSLSELRAIEHQRIADERAAIDRAIAAERDSKRAAEQAVRAAEEARLAAERDAVVRAEQARADAERELRLRVEAAEAAERARHQAALEQQRLDQEMELRRAEVAKKRPTWMLAVTMIAVVAGVALAIFAGLRAIAADDADARAQQAIAAKADAQRDAHEARAQLDKLEHDLDALDQRVHAAQDKVAAAQTAVDREKARVELIELGKQQAAQRKRIQDAKDRDAKKERDKIIDVSGCANTATGCLPTK